MIGKRLLFVLLEKLMYFCLIDCDNLRINVDSSRFIDLLCWWFFVRFLIIKFLIKLMVIFWCVKLNRIKLLCNVLMWDVLYKN